MHYRGMINGLMTFVQVELTPKSQRYRMSYKRHGTSKITGSLTFVQQSFQLTTMKTSKLCITGPLLWRKLLVTDGWILFTKGQWCGKRLRAITPPYHYNNAIMSAMESQITSVSIVCSTVCSDADQRKHQSSATLALVRGIHRWPVDSPHKGPAMRKFFHLMTS